MAKIVITNGVIHSDEDFELRSGADANTRTRFRLCKTNTGRTRFQSLSAHTGIFKDTLEVCGNLTVHGTCTTLNTTVTATTTSTENNFTIVSTDAGAADAPDFKLYRNSASPANGDDVGKIKFTGNDTAGNETLYSGIFGEIITSGTGAECGRLVFETLCNGSNFRVAYMEQNGLWVCRNLYIAGGGSLRNYGAALNLSTGGDYKIVFQPNSTTKMCLDGGELTVCNKVYTPILRATNCTFYGACGSSKLSSSNDQLLHTTQYGWIKIGPGNSSWAHITTDRNCFYFNAPLAVDGGHIRSYDEDLYFSRGTSTTNRINIGTAVTTSCQPMNICGSGGAAVICAAHDLDAYATIGRAKIGCMGHADWAGFAHMDSGGTGNFGLLHHTTGRTILNAAASQTITFTINNSTCALFCSDGSFTACKGIRATGSGWIYASSYFQGCRLYAQEYTGCFHFCSGNMAGNNWMTAGRLYPGGSWQLNSRRGYTIPNTANATCWFKFGSMCIPQHGYKMQMKVVASNGYGSGSDSTQETTLIFQTANTGEGASGSSVCAAVHSFIEGSTKHECGAPFCFIVHEVNSSFYEFFGRFNTYTGDGSYYTVDHGPSSGWIACNSFVDPDSCTGSCIVSVPNRGTIFCASASTTCICGSAIVQGDICMNNNSRGYKLGTDTGGSGSRAFLVLDSDGSDGIGVGSDYFFVTNDGSDTKFYNEGPEHIRLCGSSCVAFCKPIAAPCVNATTCLRTNIIRNQTGNLYLNVYSGCNDSAAGGIYFRSCGGTSRGYVYFDGTSNFGLLNCAGTWSLKIVGDQSGTIHSCSVHCFQKNIGLAGGSASRVCIGGSRAIEGNSGILSLGEDFTSICLRAGCTYSNAPMYIGGKVSVGTATCPPEMFGVCGNGMRIAHSAGNPVLYFGTSYGSVDIGLQRAGADQLDFKYYESGWQNAFCLNKGCTKSCICHQSPILCATSCVKSPIVCGTTCLATNIIAGSGSAASDYGTIQIQGNKNNWGGIHTCGYTFMACSNCSAAGIYNDSTNEWLIKGLCNGATLLYFNGVAKGVTLANGLRACGAASGSGYVDLCPAGAWVNMITDRSKFYMNTGLSVNSGCISSYDEDLTLHRGHANSTAAERIVITSGTTHICQLTKIHGNLCVTGQVCADGMQGDECTTVAVRTTISCFHPGCVVGTDNVYDIFVSANPNCDGGNYRDIHHIQAYVSTGYSGSAVTTYINSRQVMAVGGYGGDCGATPSTQASVHLVNGSGAHAYEYAASCTLCLGIQLCGGQPGGTNCCRRALECVIVKKIL